MPALIKGLTMNKSYLKKFSSRSCQTRSLRMWAWFLKWLVKLQSQVIQETLFKTSYSSTNITQRCSPCGLQTAVRRPS